MDVLNCLEVKILLSSCLYHLLTHMALTFKSAIVCTLTYLVNINGNADDDVQQVSECQAGDQYVGPITHALILIDDS